MANSVMLDIHGPDWPLGLITVATSGTPVGIMSLVDPSGINDPSKATSSTAPAQEYTARAQQIMFQAIKSTGPVVNNTGAIYIVRYASRNGGGSGNKSDPGAIVWTLQPGANLFLASAPQNTNTWGPYRYYIDSDTNGDGCLVTLIVG